MNEKRTKPESSASVPGLTKHHERRRERTLALLGDAFGSSHDAECASGMPRCPLSGALEHELTETAEWRAGWRQRWALEDHIERGLWRLLPRRRATRRVLRALVAEGTVEHLEAHGFDWYRLTIRFGDGVAK